MSMFTLEEVNQAINMAVDETSRKAVEVLSNETGIVNRTATAFEGSWAGYKRWKHVF